MARFEAVQAVSSVWTKTLASDKNDLPRKDLIVVEGITSPTDIANYTNDLEYIGRQPDRGEHYSRPGGVP